MEHKYLYRRAKGPVPEGDEIVPIGVAATRREGSARKMPIQLRPANIYCRAYSKKLPDWIADFHMA